MKVWQYRKHTTKDYHIVYQENPRQHICDVDYEDDARSIVDDHNAMETERELRAYNKKRAAELSTKGTT